MTSQRPHLLQLFGERCSGTNYVEQLLRRNLTGLRPTDQFGWKHGYSHAVRGATPECLFVVVHRDPFDWLRSLCAMPWHAGASLRDRDLHDFLREPWWCEWGRDMEIRDDDPRRGTEMMHERDPATGQRFANVMRMRSAKMRDWARLTERVQHCIELRYEDAASQPGRVVTEVARRCGLRRWPWLRRVRNFKGGPQRFVPKDYAPIGPKDVTWIVSQLDHELERRAGYDVAGRAAELRLASER